MNERKNKGVIGMDGEEKNEKEKRCSGGVDCSVMGKR